VSLTLLLPIFLLAAIGAVLGRLGWLRAGWQAGVAELTAKGLIPALLLTSTYRTGLPATVSWQVLAAFYAPLLGLFLGVGWLNRGRDDRAGTALAATYSNTVFVGIPVLIQMVGSASLQFAYPVIAFHSLACFALYYMTGAAGGAGHRRLVSSIGNTLANPIVVSLFAGLALNLGGITLPGAVMRVLDMLAGAALPCALLSLGASLAALRLDRLAHAASVAAANLVVLPLSVFALATFVLHLPAQVRTVLVVLAACPVGVNAAFVIRADGKDTHLVDSAILLSSLACAATMPLWLWSLKMA
jgi:predicted permease